MTTQQTALVKQLETSAFNILKQLQGLSRDIAIKQYDSEEAIELHNAIMSVTELCDTLQYMREYSMTTTNLPYNNEEVF